MKSEQPSPLVPRVPIWAQPHVDAQAYLLDLIRTLAKSESTFEPPDDELLFDASDALIIESGWIDDLYYWGYDSRQPNSFAYYGTDPYYPTDDPYRDEEAEIRDQIARAVDDLRTRDVADLLGCLEEVLDLRGGLVLQREWHNGVVEHWSSVLDIPLPERDQPKDELEREVRRAITNLCVKLCEMIARDPNALRHIEWRRLEEVIATALEGLGFCVELTPPAKDGGRDVIAGLILKGKWITYYVELKHWRSGKRVGIRPVYDFVEVNLLDKTDGGLLISTSGYAGSVWSQLGEVTQYRVHLGGADKVCSLCQRFSRSREGLWRKADELPRILFEDTIGK